MNTGRKILVGVLVVITAVLSLQLSPALATNNLASCSKPPKIWKGIEDEFLDLNPDPLFRAATIPIWTKSGFGHLGLYEYETPFSRTKKLYLSTVEHVAVMSRNACAAFWIPGTEITGQIEWENFRLIGKKGEDRVAIYSLPTGIEEALKKAVKGKVIEPLTPQKSIGDLEGKSAKIPRADTGKYTVYTIGEVHPTALFLETQGKKGIVCKGRSGQAIIIETVDGPRVVAIVSEIGALVEDHEGNTCGYALLGTRVEVP